MVDAVRFSYVFSDDILPELSYELTSFHEKKFDLLLPVVKTYVKTNCMIEINIHKKIEDYQKSLDNGVTLYLWTRVKSDFIFSFLINCLSGSQVAILLINLSKKTK